MSKIEADYLLKISVQFLKKHGYFQGWKSGTLTWTGNGRTSSVSIHTRMLSEGGSYMNIQYALTDRGTGEKKEFDYKVPITTSSCHFGGVRHWFVCPLYSRGVYCGKRVGTLYKAGDYFACRHCYDLTYSARNENYGRKYAVYTRFFSLDGKIAQAEERLKKKTYKGKLTKQAKKVLRLYTEMEHHMNIYGDARDML